MPQKIQTSLIIPAFNEELVIGQTLQSLAQYYKNNQDLLGSTELIVVAAGTDSTPQIAKTFSKSFTKLKVITPSKKGGKGRDVRLGFKAATGQNQIFMDADLATPIHHLKTTITKLNSGSADVVIGVRNLRKIHPGFLRTLFSLGSNLITRLLLFPTIKDTQCGYKGFTKSAAQKAFKRQRLNGWGFDIELIKLSREEHLKIYQQPIPDWNEVREEGLRGDGLFKSGLRTLADVFLVRLEGSARFANRHFRLILSLSMLASFSLAIFLSLKQSIWFDEGYTILLIKRPISELLSLTAVDAHPPLYYLLLKSWAAIFGMSEFALRAFSALCTSLAIGAMALLIKKLFSKSAAISALPFMVLAPFVLRYAYEIRMYSLAGLIGVLATYVLVLAWQKDKLKYWLLYGTLLALGLYTLYMSVLIWFAHALWLLFVTLKNKKNLLRQKFIWGYLLSLVLFAPYVPTVLGQFQHSALSGVASQVTPSQLVTSFTFFSIYQPEWQVSTLLTFPLLIFLILIIRSTGYASRLFNKQEKDYYLLFGLILIAPIFFLAVASLLKPYYLERYLAHIFIFGYAGIGLTLNIVWRKGRHLGAIALTSAAILTFSIGLIKLNQTGNFNYQNLTKPSAKQIRAQISDCQTSTIVADEPFVYIDAEYYYSGCDLKFYNKDELGPYGGYVPLRFSSARIDSTAKLNSLRIYHLHFKDVDNLKLKQDPRYELTSSKIINEKYYLDEYELKPNAA